MKMTKNLHLEHPEDSILNGELSVLNWFTADSNISAKIDGSPAIVWGTNPVNNKFFVGTKSVFNKKLIKINYNHRDVDRNHKGKVADILHKCLDNLPVTDNIYQAITSVVVALIVSLLIPSDTISQIKFFKKS